MNLKDHPPGTRLKLRDGRQARILATDLKGERPICIAILRADLAHEDPENVTADGLWAAPSNSRFDVVGII